MADLAKNLADGLTTVFSVGHGSRIQEEFAALLGAADIALLVDVRAYPASRRFPHFSRASLEVFLAHKSIAYDWQGKDLGGYRKPKPASAHAALKNAGFRGFADHMESLEFKTAVDRLIKQAKQTKLAIMCAERLPWECHRYLISDYLVMLGVRVIHLIAPGNSREHELSPLARVSESRLIYDKTGQLDLGM